MKRAMERKDDYLERRGHLKEMSEEELEAKFWKLTEKLMDPVIKLAETHTSPSIERSVLLRMGFSSLEATAIVKQVLDHGLIGKGAGHIVYKISKKQGIEIREAGLQLADGKLWEEVALIFQKTSHNKDTKPHTLPPDPAAPDDIPSVSKDAIYRVSAKGDSSNG